MAKEVSEQCYDQVVLLVNDLRWPDKGSHVCKGWSFDISLTWFERVSLGMAVCQVLRALVILDRKYSYPKLDFEGMPKSALFARKHNFRSCQLLIASFRFN